VRWWEFSQLQTIFCLIISHHLPSHLSHHLIYHHHLPSPISLVIPIWFCPIFGGGWEEIKIIKIWILIIKWKSCFVYLFMCDQLSHLINQLISSTIISSYQPSTISSPPPLTCQYSPTKQCHDLISILISILDLRDDRWDGNLWERFMRDDKYFLSHNLPSHLIICLTIYHLISHSAFTPVAPHLQDPIQMRW